MSYRPRLKEDYSNSIASALMEKLGHNNIMQVPKLKKIVISRGVGAAVADKKLIDHAIDELTLIAGQKALATLSKKDVASFKLMIAISFMPIIAVKRLGLITKLLFDCMEMTSPSR